MVVVAGTLVVVVVGVDVVVVVGLPVVVVGKSSQGSTPRLAQRSPITVPPTAEQTEGRRSVHTPSQQQPFSGAMVVVGDGVVVGTDVVVDVVVVVDVQTTQVDTNSQG